MEKWRNEIEEILFKSRTVDRWLIHDFVWKERDPAPMQFPAPTPLRKALIFLFMGPVFMSEPVWREEIGKLLTEAGLREETVADVIEHAKHETDQLPPWPGLKRDTNEETQASGDDE